MNKELIYKFSYKCIYSFSYLYYKQVVKYYAFLYYIILYQISNIFYFLFSGTTIAKPL